MTERWTLTVRFDPPGVQEKNNPERTFPHDECSSLIAFIGHHWGLLPEEIKEIVTWNADTATFHLDQIEFAATLTQWVCMNSIPQSVTLIRNEER